MFKSRTKKSKCGYCSVEMLDDNLKAHCLNVHGKWKLVKGQQTLFSHAASDDYPRTKKSKQDDDGPSKNTSASEPLKSDESSSKLSESLQPLPVESMTVDEITHEIESVHHVSEPKIQRVDDFAKENHDDRYNSKLEIIESELKKLENTRYIST